MGDVIVKASGAVKKNFGDNLKDFKSGGPYQSEKAQKWTSCMTQYDANMLRRWIKLSSKHFGVRTWFVITVYWKRQGMNSILRVCDWESWNKWVLLAAAALTFLSFFIFQSVVGSDKVSLHRMIYTNDIELSPSMIDHVWFIHSQT